MWLNCIFAYETVFSWVLLDSRRNTWNCLRWMSCDLFASSVSAWIVYCTTQSTHWQTHKNRSQIMQRDWFLTSSSSISWFFISLLPFSLFSQQMNVIAYWKYSVLGIAFESLIVYICVGCFFCSIQEVCSKEIWSESSLLSNFLYSFIGIATGTNAVTQKLWKWYTFLRVTQFVLGKMYPGQC